MPRPRTNLSNMTEEQRLEHRRMKWREKSRKWRARNPEKHRAEVKAWAAANPDKIKAYQRISGPRYDENHRERRRGQWRDWNTRNKQYREGQNRVYKYKRQYNITIEEYDALVVRQNGRCGICGTDQPSARTRYWNVDHCHETGQIRGLLCAACNRGGGMFKDDPELLRKATEWFTKR